MIVKSFGQKKCINFEKIFSPIVKMSSIQVVLRLTTSLNLEVEQLDMKIAFLYDDLKEKKLYGAARWFIVKGKENLVYRLKKELVHT